MMAHWCLQDVQDAMSHPLFSEELRELEARDASASELISEVN